MKNNIISILLIFVAISASADARKLFFEAPKKEQKPPVVTAVKKPAEPVKKHSASVQTPVKAAGENNKTTFLPFKALSVVGCLSVFVNVKSGAICPT